MRGPCHICTETGLNRICTGTGLTPCHICNGTGLTPATSAPGLGSGLQLLFLVISQLHFGRLLLQPSRVVACEAPTAHTPPVRTGTKPHSSSPAGMEWNPSQRHSALRIVTLADLPIPAQPCPGADVVRASPVPVQMWQGWAQSRCRCGGGGPTMERLDPPLIQFERPARHIVQKVSVVSHL